MIHTTNNLSDDRADEVEMRRGRSRIREEEDSDDDSDDDTDDDCKKEVQPLWAVEDAREARESARRSAIAVDVGFCWL